MEQAVEDLKQQNLEIRAEMRMEMGQMREQINKMFELLTRNTTLNTAAAAQGVALSIATQGTPTTPRICAPSVECQYRGSTDPSRTNRWRRFGSWTCTGIKNRTPPNTWSDSLLSPASKAKRDYRTHTGTNPHRQREDKFVRGTGASHQGDQGPWLGCRRSLHAAHILGHVMPKDGLIYPTRQDPGVLFPKQPNRGRSKMICQPGRRTCKDVEGLG
ncbi:hypothetical protein CR513_32336, partial [Mucuna pruriens]